MTTKIPPFATPIYIKNNVGVEILSPVWRKWFSDLGETVTTINNTVNIISGGSTTNISNLNSFSSGSDASSYEEPFVIINNPPSTPLPQPGIVSFLPYEGDSTDAHTQASSVLNYNQNPYYNSLNVITKVTSSTFTSTVAIGTAPFTVTSTTPVANLSIGGNAATATTASTVTTNANLTGPITSVGNATSIASQTGTGTKFVVDTSPTLVTPNIGVASGTSLSVSGQLTSTVASGTAPLVVSSTTNVSNLNASSLNGATFASPGSIGNTSAGSGAFTTLSATSTITPSTTAGIVGTTAADSAQAGSVGELKTASGNSGAMTINTWADITSISLTAGDWDVDALVSINGTGGSTFTQQLGTITTTSATIGSFGQYWNLISPVSSQGSALPTPTSRINVSGTITVYVAAFATFAVGGCNADGLIRARRVR